MDTKQVIEFVNKRYITKSNKLNQNMMREETVKKHHADFYTSLLNFKGTSFREKILLILNGDIKCKYCKTKSVKQHSYNKTDTYCSIECKNEGIRLENTGKKQSKELIEKRIKPLRGRTRPEQSEKLKEHYKSAAGIKTKNRLSEVSKKNWQNEQYRENHSKMLKEKILSGEFTPNITNSWTRWGTEVNGKKFRSSWEGIYHLMNPEHKYEKIRIPYVNELGETKIYITDFFDEQTKTVIEIKPSELTNSKINIIKEEAAKTFCSANNYTYKIITQNEIFAYAEYLKGSHPFVDGFCKKYGL